MKNQNSIEVLRQSLASAFGVAFKQLGKRSDNLDWFGEQKITPKQKDKKAA